jgi:Phosphotransferase enzyme family
MHPLLFREEVSADTLKEEVAALLELSGPDVGRLTVKPCRTGGNNRVYVVGLPERKIVAKRYFSRPSDPRDRLRAEYAFLTYARRIGIDIVPRPLACDPARRLGLYECVEGRALRTDELNESHVEQAAQFFVALNDVAAGAAAHDLPIASEACFSIAEHFALVDRRIERLEAITDVGHVDRDAREFAGSLGARWTAVKKSIEARVSAQGESIDDAVPTRCISPSDFGFHNALVASDGRLHFIDFEYAGWDDPAKMAGDFITHPGFPVPPSWFDRFLTATTRYSPLADVLCRRARLLLPIFQTKWCCIILNEFLPNSAERRRFADPDVDERQRKQMQLRKATALLELIGTQALDQSFTVG